MKKSLPSSDAAAEFLRGTEGGTGKIIASTVLRSVLILPGLLVVGVEPKKAVFGSLISSGLITGFILIYMGADAPKRVLGGTRKRRQLAGRR
jgi:hypothetical protein